MHCIVPILRKMDEMKLILTWNYAISTPTTILLLNLIVTEEENRENENGGFHLLGTFSYLYFISHLPGSSMKMIYFALLSLSQIWKTGLQIVCNFVTRFATFPSTEVAESEHEFTIHFLMEKKRIRFSP